jgi:tRNA(Ile)-lysidine synthase
MLNLLGKIPRNVTVACSGGVDSMVVLDFLKKNHEVQVAYFNHATPHGDDAETFLRHYCKNNSLSLVVGTIGSKKLKEESKEEYWRRERYAFLDQFDFVVTGHHLDDVVETWIWSCLHGTPSLIPYQRNNVYRPFLLNEKSKIKDWASRKKIVYINDPSNHDTQYTRNFIRQNMVENALVVNPGLHSVLKKKLKLLYENNDQKMLDK